MDYEELLSEHGVGALNDALNASSMRKMNLATIPIETCGPRMPGDTKIIRESDASNCGNIKWGELCLCTEHFDKLKEDMTLSGKLLWQW